MTTLELKLSVSDSLLERLQSEADRRHVPLGELVNEALEAYFEEDADALSKEQVLANLRQGLQDAFNGNYRPAREVLAELERDSDD